MGCDMLVARFTPNPAADIARGWSGTGGDGAFLFDSLEEAIATLGDLELFDEKYRGRAGDDEIAEKFGFRFDTHLGKWREFHHWGLSCWPLDSGSDLSAMLEAKLRCEEGSIASGGVGWATVGTVYTVAKVPEIPNLWIFECDGVVGE